MLNLVNLVESLNLKTWQEHVYMYMYTIYIIFLYTINTIIIQSVDHADDDHQDLPNIDHTPDKQDEDHKTDQQSSPIVPTSSNAQTPPTSVGAGHASYVKQKKPKKSKRQNNDDTVVFNDTFLDDSDL